MVENGNNVNMGKKEDGSSKDIDWLALDEHWSEQYERDYGYLFGKK